MTRQSRERRSTRILPAVRVRAAVPRRAEPVLLLPPSRGAARCPPAALYTCRRGGLRGRPRGPASQSLPRPPGPAVTSCPARSHRPIHKKAGGGRAGGGGRTAAHDARPHAPQLPPPPPGSLRAASAVLLAPRRLCSDGRGCGREAGAYAQCRAEPNGSLPAGARSPRRLRAAALAVSPGLAPRWDPAALEEIITVISAAAITGTGRCGAFRRSEEAGGGSSGPPGGCGLPAAAAAPRITAEDPLHLPPGCLHGRRSVCRGVSRTGEKRKAASGPGGSREEKNPHPRLRSRRWGGWKERGEAAAPGPSGSGSPPCGAAEPRPQYEVAPRVALSLSAPRLRAGLGGLAEVSRGRGAGRLVRSFRARCGRTT